MSKVIKWTTGLATILCLWATAHGKTCTEQKVRSYTVYQMNTFTQKLNTAIKYRNYIEFVCCEGYRETSRISKGMEPKCDPICEPACGNGTCYAPQLCSCEFGYTHSELGNCVPDATVVIQATETEKKIQKTSFKPSTSDQKTNFRDIGESSKPTTRSTAIDISRMPTTEDIGAKTANFIPARGHAAITTTRRSRMGKCGTCDHGTCVDGTCVCALGYGLTQEGYCQPVCSQSCLNGRCVEPNRCECIDGYTYDSESLQCRPLCNGKIYGCIRGTCVGYNQCRCDNGTILDKDELFHCVFRDLLQQTNANSWYLLLLLLPAVAVVACFCIIISRWKRAKANRVDGQEDSFPEVRFHNARTDHSSTEEYQKACSKDKYPMEDASYSKGTIRRNGNVVIINT